MADGSGTIFDLLFGLGIDATDYEEGLNSAEEHSLGFASTVSGQVSKTVITAFAGMGLAVGGFAASSIGVAADFEKGMLSFSSVTGSALTDAGFDIDDFKDKFLQLGKETAFSAAQAQDAAIALAKGGVPIASIMEDATSATLALASAGELELGPAADIVAKQLGVWADRGVTAGQVADLLAQAANASTVDVDELAAGLANAGGVAHVMGMSYTDLITTMAEIAPAFSSASDAGTSLKAFMMGLIPKTKDANAAFDELGLSTLNVSKITKAFTGDTQFMNTVFSDGILTTEEASKWLDTYAQSTHLSAKKTQELNDSFTTSKFFDAEGNFVGMAKASEYLKDATKDLTSEQKVLALNTIFGSDAIRAASVIADGGSDAFEDMGLAMQGAGTAAEQAEKKNQGLKFAWDTMLGSVETLQIVIGSALLPILTTLVNDVLTPGINVVLEFASSITAVEDPIGMVIDMLIPFSPLLASIVAAIADFITSGGDFNLALQDIAEGLDLPVIALQPFITIIQEVVKLVGDNLYPVLEAVGIIIAGALTDVLIGAVIAFGAFIAPIVAAIAIVAGLKAAVDSNFMGIRDMINMIMSNINNVITTVFGSILEFWNQNGAAILAKASEVWTTIQTAITSVVNAVSGLIQEVFGIILEFWKTNGQDIMNFAMETWNSIMEIIGSVVALVSEIITAAFTTIKDFLATHGDKIQAVLTAAWDVIKTVVTTVINVVKDVIATVTAIIHGDWDKAWESIKKLFFDIWEGIKGIVTSAIELVKSGLDLAWAAIQGAVEKVWTGIKNFIGGIWDDIVRGIKDSVNAIIDGVNVLIDGLNAVNPFGEIGHVGHLASGTTNWKGGLAEIGELGPEMVKIGDFTGILAPGIYNLPRGTQVTPNDETRGIMNSIMGRGHEGSGNKHEWNLDVHYQTMQSEATLRDDIRTFALLNG